MSYCVNCGVELEKTEKVCPLCHTPVINPNQKKQEDGKRPYPNQVHKIYTRVNKLFWVELTSLLLGFIIAIILLTNLFANGAITWSIYAVMGIVLLWLFVEPPLIFRKPSPFICLLIDGIGIILFLFLVEWLTAPGTWFIPLGLPIVLLAVLLTCACAFIITFYHVKDLYIGVVVVVAMALMAFGLNLLLSLYLTGRVSIGWSWFVAIPLLAIAAVFFVVEHNKGLKAEITKRLHI